MTTTGKTFDVMYAGCWAETLTEGDIEALRFALAYRIRELREGVKTGADYWGPKLEAALAVEKKLMAILAAV